MPGALTTPLRGLGKLHLARGDPSRARTFFERSLAVLQGWEEAYNRAGFHALFGERDEALRQLRRAVDLGYRNAGWMAQDPDLASVHDNPDFEEIVVTLRSATEQPARTAGVN